LQLHPTSFFFGSAAILAASAFLASSTFFKAAAFSSAFFLAAAASSAFFLAAAASSAFFLAAAASSAFLMTSSYAAHMNLVLYGVIDTPSMVLYEPFIVDTLNDLPQLLGSVQNETKLPVSALATSNQPLTNYTDKHSNTPPKPISAHFAGAFGQAF